MNLFFVRHGDALHDDVDERRQLSALGERQSAGLGDFLKHAGVMFDAAYSSPLIRARQTTELVLGRTNAAQPIEFKFTGALVNNTGLREFRDWLDELPEHRNVLLVGHEPRTSERIRSLLTVEAPFAVRMETAACCSLVHQRGQAGMLQFFVTPAALGIR